MSDKMRILIVEPEKAPRVACIENTLEAMQDIVGGYIEVVVPMQFYDEDVVIVCNEEGKLLDLAPNMFLTDRNGQPYDIIHGTFFICRAPVDSDAFASLTDEQMNRYFWMCM